MSYTPGEGRYYALPAASSEPAARVAVGPATVEVDDDGVVFADYGRVFPAGLVKPRAGEPTVEVDAFLRDAGLAQPVISAVNSCWAGGAADVALWLQPWCEPPCNA